MEKTEAKTTLRYPQKVKEEFKRIADEEGLSENAGVGFEVQGANACSVKTTKPHWLQPQGFLICQYLPRN
ncbi:TPA: hypothetical protein ACSRD7_003244 [Yersinia enterocolitica]|nr:hypothetical protein [Yersinia enterocolitica]HEN3309678.1 hypothetical protein [Yersinia enterocolitica]